MKIKYRNSGGDFSGQEGRNDDLREIEESECKMMQIVDGQLWLDDEVCICKVYPEDLTTEVKPIDKDKLRRLILG